jgi:peroxiredoxin
MDFDNHFVFKAWAQQKASSAYISFLVKGPNGPRTKQLSYTLRAQR